MTRSEPRDWEDETDVCYPAVPVRSGRRRVVASAISIAIAWSFLLGIAGPSSAAPDTRIDVQPEVLEVLVGQSVTLTAYVRDADGDALPGNTHVRWYFGPDSPNDPSTGNASHDFDCHTLGGDSCSITYQADVVGTDTICALVGGSPASCNEPQTDADWDDNADVVLRIAVVSLTPDPTPTRAGTPTPAATATPTATPTATATATATPTATATATPTATAMPTATATATPTPTPTTAPTPTPTAVASPTSAATATATPTATPTPTATATATPLPVEQPRVVSPTPMTTPTPAPSSTPTPSPTSKVPTPTGEPEIALAPVPSASPSDPPLTEPKLTIDPRRVKPVVAPRAEPAPRMAAPTHAPQAPENAPVGPVHPIGPVEAVGQVVGAAVEQVAQVVRPDAAVAIATQFTFPIALAIAVLIYLAIQGHIDRRDPKLRTAPQNVVETLVMFRTEDEL